MYRRKLTYVTFTLSRADISWNTLCTSESLIIERSSYEFETLLNIGKYVNNQALIKFQHIFLFESLEDTEFLELGKKA